MTNKPSTYMAGELFTVEQRAFNRLLRDALVKLGYDKKSIFLPQESEANRRANFDHEEVVRNDQQGVYESDLVIVKLDGATVDDGTSLEAGLGVARNKITVGYRTDFRGHGDDPKLGVNLMFRLLDAFIYLPSKDYDHLPLEEFAKMLAGRIDEAVRHVAAQRTGQKADPVWR